MKPKAVVLDLDGTTCNSQVVITDYTKQVLNKLHYEMNIPVIIATGRSYPGADLARADIGLDSPIITGNGSKVHGKSYDVVLHAKYIDYEILDFALSLDIGNDVSFNVIANDNWYSKNNELVHWSRKDFTPMKSSDYFRDKKITTMSFYSPELSNIEAIEKKLLENFEKRIEIVYVGEHSIEITTHGCSKLSGVREALKVYGLTTDDAIAFGDSFNDYEMLKGVGRGVIMGNAMERLKEKLPHLEQALTNDEEGVAKFLVEVFEL